MAAFLAHWNKLEHSRKAVAVLGVVTLFVVVAALIRMATTPSMALLYSGLEARQAGEVVRALEQRGDVYDIKGGTIFVPSAKRDELRMTLASEGLPANSAQGYELLDSLSGFGTTSQMFEAAYLRAKEGELARTIVSSSQISMARVHIAQGRVSSFSRRTPGSASVFVTPANGPLAPSQAKALRFLVASAMPGLEPEHVSVIDDSGQLISADGEADGTQTTDLPASLKEKVERMLAARVGTGNAVVEVSVETTRQTEAVFERTFDPENRVAISTDTEERTDSAEDKGKSGVTVASNLPDGDGANGETSKSQASETRERINYEVSEVKREITKSAGSIKRLSVAVLVNGEEDPTNPGTLVPRSDTELAQLETLVRSAVGFDETRGDIVTVQSMAFSEQAPLGTGPIENPLFDFTLDAMTLIQMAILGLTGLVIALAVVRPILVPKPETAPPLAIPSVGHDVGLSPLEGEIDFVEPKGEMLAIQNAGNTGDTDKSPAQRLREMIETRQEETVDILRQWLEHKEQQGL